MTGSDMQGRGGLTSREAAGRLAEYGPNELSREKKISGPALFLGQFRDSITLVLMAATVISFFLGEAADAAAILCILVVNGILGFVQEYRTEKSLAALRELSAPHANVLRDGHTVNVPAREVVPGDVVLVEAGDRVCADCAILEQSSLQADESILTGESEPVEKTAHAVEHAAHQNMLFMGTTVIAGNGRAVVRRTGMHTEMGKIAGMLQSVEQQDTPLKKRLNKVGKQLILLCLAVCGLIVVAGLFHGETIYNMFLSGVSLAVAAIPEGLPAIVTVSLAIGVQRMLRRNALIRKLPAVETLGSVNIICSDKTGTLTENRMTVVRLFTLPHRYGLEGEAFWTGGQAVRPTTQPILRQLLLTGMLCNNATQDNGEVQGDPTEAAILTASLYGLEANEARRYRRVKEYPFDSDRKCMSVVCRDVSGDVLYVKGAPDRLLERCTRVRSAKGEEHMSQLDKSEIIREYEEMASGALRVLAFAYRPLHSYRNGASSEEVEKDLVFLGLEGMLDPPRSGVREAIASCYHAGIRPVMITGDHKITAVAIAREVGINTGDVLTGEEIETLSERELERRLTRTDIFARVTPGHKLRIVRAFKRTGIVAMTGDGVNDAPALKEADIGVAMGKGGTDVAREAAAMVLLDNNFTTIVAAIEEGRMIYSNIRKFIRYLLSCNLGEILMMGVAAFLGMPMPLVPIQILWVNLVTDGLPALALGVDPPEQDSMSHPPHDSKEGIFSGGLGRDIAWSGILIGGSSIAAFALALRTTGDLAQARTVAFCTMIVAELLYSFECRHERGRSRGKTRLNVYLILANLSSFLLMLAVMYLPFLSGVFQTTHLGTQGWLMVAGFGGIEFIFSSIRSRRK